MSTTDFIPADLRRPIGNTGISVAPLGFGCSPLGNEFGVIDQQKGIDAVHHAVKIGVNYFDVSPYYGRGRAETVLGKALVGLPRDQFVVSTKVGRYDTSSFDFSAARVIKSVDESLSRLGLSYIDMVLCHDIEFGDLDQIATETLPALLKLKESGKVRAIGITGYPLEIFPYVLAAAPQKCVDVVLSYCNYSLQNDRLNLLLPALKREGVAVINASPLCMGLLTNRTPPDWHPAPKRVHVAAKKASELCESKGIPLAQLAMDYALEQDGFASTLVGISDTNILMKNVASVGRVPDAALVQQVKKVFQDESAFGVRWKSGKIEG